VKRLGLFRHAKSDWHDARARDFDRPLNKRGRKGAEMMGAHIATIGIAWQRIIASPAVRVAQTIELAAKASKTIPHLLDLLREQEGDPAAIVMVGHNPGLEDLIFDLVPDDGSSPLRDMVEEKFPTAAFAVLELDIDKWSDADDNCARLAHLMRPRDIDPALGPSLED